MRFVGYIPAVLRGIKVEWDIPVEITDENPPGDASAR